MKNLFPSLLAGLLVSVSIAQAQTIIIGGGDGTGTNTRNGNFNSGTNLTAGGTDFWENLEGLQSVGIRNDSTLLFNGTPTLTASAVNIVGQSTGHSMIEGDVFSLNYVWRDAAGFNDVNDRLFVRLFKTADNTISGTATTLFNGLQASTINDTYEPVNLTSVYTATAADVGSTLFVSIGIQDNTPADTPFARVDNFNLTVIPEPSSLAILSVSGAGLIFLRRRRR